MNQKSSKKFVLIETISVSLKTESMPSDEATPCFVKLSM